MLDNYKVIELQLPDATVKNRFYVMQLCYVDKQNKPKYRLVKQCSSAEKANEYVKEHSL